MIQNPAEVLCSHVIRQYGARLTSVQLRGPWTYIGTKHGEISGVVIDADGAHPGFRLMLVDLGLAEFSATPATEPADA